MFVSYEESNEPNFDSYIKKLQSIELEILKEFIRICDKYNLNYFLIGGGLIGAIRHKGFIPWDDDLDIAMLREDYEKFLSVAEKEIKEEYFIQYHKSEKDYFDTLLRIRDSKSTGVLKKDIDKDCNNGVFIEVYVYDNVPSNYLIQRIHGSFIKVFCTLLYDYHYEVKTNSFSRKIMKCFSKLYCKCISFESTVQLWDNTRKFFSKIKTKYVNCEMSKEAIISGRSRWKVEDVKKVIEVPFEDILVKVPHNYDTCLRKCYGDYMKIPTVEERNQHHMTEVMYDPFTPYAEYCSLEKRQYLKEKINAN